MGLALAGMTGRSRKGVARLVDDSAEKLNFHLASLQKERVRERRQVAGGRQGLSSDGRQGLGGRRMKDR